MEKAKILLVDDSPSILEEVNYMLQDRYTVYTLPQPELLEGLLKQVSPDMFLLDYQMPKITGFELIPIIRGIEGHAETPIIFLTGRSDSEIEADALRLGAVDFITKPFSELVLKTRIQTHLNIDELIRDRTSQLKQRTEQLERLQGSMVSVLSDMVEGRDEITGGHIERTTAYIEILITAMIRRGLYLEEMSGWESELDVIASSASLHDIGKITVSDTILNKPGKLTDEEFEIMKTHAAAGEKMIDSIIAKAGEDANFLQHAKLFAGYHHEKWIGNGYPHGLSGTDIPLQGRIMAIADVYDALVCDRPYKKGFPPEKAEEIITEGSGKHFDPQIVNVFLEERSNFRNLLVQNQK